LYSSSAGAGALARTIYTAGTVHPLTRLPPRYLSWTRCTNMTLHVTFTYNGVAGVSANDFDIDIDDVIYAIT